MKIQCDVCAAAEAAVFCCADEAALCETCDRRVHRANKLAGKHRRLSLLRPTSADLAPRCDICQEKKAFLFCQEDRAILCKDCDASIHSANELTMKHNRFLLTGVKVSSTATVAEPVGNSGGVPAEEDKVGGQRPEKPVNTQIAKGCKSSGNSDISSDKEGAVVLPEVESAGGGGDHSSSISDYLINTLPGWCVDDLLLDYPSSTSSSPFCFASPTFCKMGIEEEDLLPFMDSGEMGIGDASTFWKVPRVPQMLPTPPTAGSFHHGVATAAAAAAPAGEKRWRSDDGFTVPQITSQHAPPPLNKRSRTTWYA